MAFVRIIEIIYLTLMSKLFFITRYSLSKKFNLKVKFDGQMNALRNLGYDVYYLAFDDKYYYLVHNEERKPIMRVFAVESGLYYHILAYIFLYISVLRVLRLLSWGKADVAYIRSMPHELYWRKMTRRMSELGMKIVVEIPTYIREGGEKPRLYIRLFSWILSPFRKDKYVDLYTLIGDKTDGIYNGKPAVNINNGIDVKSIQQRKPQAHDDINLVAVGNMADWHGFDRVIDGLALYSQKEKVHFYVVGSDGDGSLAKWKQKAEEYKLFDIVHFTGPLYGEELADLLSRCDVAFASLGMYRTGCFNASVLKSREYMSRGIPFVYAVNDPVVDAYPTKYAIKFPNDSSPIKIDDVIEFINGFSSTEIMVKEMRVYAEKYMSWEGQFHEVFIFLKQINNNE